MPGERLPFSEHSILGQLSIAVVGLFGTALILFCFYKIATSHYFRLPQLTRNDDADGGETLRLSTDNTLDSLPVVQFCDSLGGRSDCAICLDEFQRGEQIRTLPYCSHNFHARCVGTWLGSHSDCPLCRKKVIADPIDPYSPVSFSIGSSLETLPREDVSEERSLDYRLFALQYARYQALGGDSRGIQSLLWL